MTINSKVIRAITILIASFFFAAGTNSALAKPANSTLKITKAMYKSTTSGKGADVTDAITDICAKHPAKCEFTCAQIVLNVSDPEKNMPKECVVEYSCGKGKSKTQSVSDGQVGTLSCR